jgi:hypothetical protein
MWKESKVLENGQIWTKMNPHRSKCLIESLALFLEQYYELKCLGFGESGDIDSHVTNPWRRSFSPRHATVLPCSRQRMTTPSTRREHPKVKGAPDYDDPTYWDVKFATGKDVGEWLNSGEILIETTLSELEHRPQPDALPRALHLGPGISKLGIKLCEAIHKQNWPGSCIVVRPLVCRPLESCTNIPSSPIRMRIFQRKLSASAGSSRAARTQTRQCIGSKLT